MEARKRLIVALDVDEYSEAERLVEELSPEIDIFKVGIAPFTAYGQDILKKISEQGKQCFLDLKIHDIPNTAANAVRASLGKNIFMINFHCLGGKKMLESAVQAVKNDTGSGLRTKPILLGVTILTSMGSEEMAGIGLPGGVQEKVIELAQTAYEAGLDGVVASANEARMIKEAVGKDFLVVTPGVRPSWAASGDQKRVVSPAEAIKNGADYLVVGRPIIKDKDPKEAAKRVIQEMNEATKV